MKGWEALTLSKDTFFRLRGWLHFVFLMSGESFYWSSMPLEGVKSMLQLAFTILGPSKATAWMY